jgi:hypothetical protein
VTVTVGVAGTGTPPRIVLYPDPGDVQAARLDGQRQHLTLHILVHAIGAGPEQATWCADQARGVLLADPPLVPDRTVRRLVQTVAPPPMIRDDDVSPPLYLQVTEYRLESEPA